MSDRIEIDAVGKRCPRPIIELAKATRRADAGATIRIQADDLAFESDVRAWCETSGAALTELTRDGSTVVALITLAD